MASGYDIGALGRGLSSGIRSGVILGEGINRGKAAKRRRQALDLYEKAGTGPDEGDTIGTVRRGPDEFVGPYADPKEAIRPGAERIGKRAYYKFEQWADNLRKAGAKGGPEWAAITEKQIEAKRFELMRNRVAAGGLALRNGDGHAALDAIETASDMGFPGSNLGFQVDENGMLRNKNGDEISPSMLYNVYEQMKDPGGWEKDKAQMWKDISAGTLYDTRAAPSGGAGIDTPSEKDRAATTKIEQEIRTRYGEYVDKRFEESDVPTRLDPMFETEDQKARMWQFFTDDKRAPAFQNKVRAGTIHFSEKGEMPEGQAMDASLKFLAYTHGFDTEASITTKWLEDGSGRLVINIDGVPYTMEGRGVNWAVAEIAGMDKPTQEETAGGGQETAGGGLQLGPAIPDEAFSGIANAGHGVNDAVGGAISAAGKKFRAGAEKVFAPYNR